MDVEGDLVRYREWPINNQNDKLLSSHTSYSWHCHLSLRLSILYSVIAIPTTRLHCLKNWWSNWETAWVLVISLNQWVWRKVSMRWSTCRKATSYCIWRELWSMTRLSWCSSSRLGRTERWLSMVWDLISSRKPLRGLKNLVWKERNGSCSLRLTRNPVCNFFSNLRRNRPQCMECFHGMTSLRLGMQFAIQLCSISPWRTTFK